MTTKKNLEVQNSLLALEKIVINNDLSELSADQRLAYYQKFCEATGLNWLTRPFQYIVLNGKLTLYATKGATDQLRAIKCISIKSLTRTIQHDICITDVTVSTPDGRVESDLGAVSIIGLKGEALANAIMKSATKAKRRATLGVCGLGILDETEVETIPNAQYVPIDFETGEIAGKILENVNPPLKPELKPEIEKLETIDSEWVFKSGPYIDKPVSSVDDLLYLSNVMKAFNSPDFLKKQCLNRIDKLTEQGAR